MEVNFLQTTEHEEWNTFVEESPQGDVFCYDWWLKAVTKDDFKILVAREYHQILAGIILPFYHTKRVNEPYLTRTIGVLYKKPGHESPMKRLSMERKWLNALLDKVNRDHFVQMCLHHDFIDWLPFRWRGYRQTTRYTYIFNYEKNTINDIWTNISKAQKETIRKAMRNNIEIEETQDIELVYRFSCLSFKRQNKFFPFPMSDLQRLDNAIIKHGNRIIFKAVDRQNAIHAVFYCVYNKRSAYCLLSGGDSLLRSQGGHTLIIWHVIRYFSNKVSILNLGGSDIQPIERHLRSFGGTQTQYFHIYNETLALNEGGIKLHCSKILFHGNEIFTDLKNRSTTEYFILARKTFIFLLNKIKKRVQTISHA
jgi:hypothetical protein